MITRAGGILSNGSTTAAQDGHRRAASERRARAGDGVGGERLVAGTVCGADVVGAFAVAEEVDVGAARAERMSAR